jgi:hypothetical protein
MRVGCIEARHQAFCMSELDAGEQLVSRFGQEVVKRCGRGDKKRGLVPAENRTSNGYLAYSHFNE